MRSEPGVMGLRGIASLMVLLFHVGSALHLPSGQWLFGWGYAGVDLFFVLSGYLLTKKFLDGDYSDPKTGRFSAAVYYLRRVFRIWPLYYLALPLFAVLAAMPLSPLDLVFGQDYLASTFTGLPVWTLCIEEAFYVTVPIWASAYRSRWWPHLTLALFAVSLGWRMFIVEPSTSRFLLDQFPAYAFSYGVGSLVARGKQWRAPDWILVPIVGAGVPLLVVVQFVPVQTVFAAGLGFVVLSSWRNALALSHPIAQFFGRLTYPIYLLGFPLQLAFQASAPDPIVWVPLTVCVTIASSWAASWAVEAPMIRVGRRVEISIA